MRLKIGPASKPSRRFLAVLMSGGMLLAAVPALAAETSHTTALHPMESGLTQSDYVHHGHHYMYHYNGHYYNHREKKNGHWHYY